jgi:hypothetical protein
MTEPMESTEVIEAGAGTGVKTKVLVVLILIAAVAGGYFYNQYAKLKADPNVVNQKKIETVVSKVEKLIELPQGELPTLATVTDTSNLADQPFFKNAKVGNEVLLYANARKAYLYDPEANIIVEVASLNIGEQ